jgi:hypothetical protein
MIREAAKELQMPPVELPYPDRTALHHGDLVFPRRQDVSAITSPPELLLRGMLDRKPPQDVDTDKPFDLVAFWPELLAMLELVEKGKLTILGMIMLIRLRLGSNFDPADAADAIIGKQYVGHCAIIDREHPSGLPWVIEASHDFGGIRCVAYDLWEQQRRKVNALVWHGRIKAFETKPAWAERFVDFAHEYRMLRVPYAIFDDRESGAKFSLDMNSVEEAGEVEYLYCSELAVACVDRLRTELARDGAGDVEGLDLRMRVDGTKSGAADQFKMVTPKDLTLAAALTLISGFGPYFYPIDI